MRYSEPSLGGVLSLTSSHTDYWGLLPPLLYFLSFPKRVRYFFLRLEERDGVFRKNRTRKNPGIHQEKERETMEKRRTRLGRERDEERDKCELHTRYDLIKHLIN